MKSKKTEKFTDSMKGMVGLGQEAIPTFLFFDTNGSVVIESFSKLINYTDKEISFVSKSKRIYIYGNNLSIMSFSKNEMSIQGNIEKIELFEV